MFNLKNDHLALVKDLSSFSEERYERSLVAKFSGEYSTENFNERFNSCLKSKKGNVVLAAKAVIEDYLTLTNEHPSDNTNALFDIPLLYLLFNQPEVKSLMSPDEIVQLVQLRRAQTTIYDRKAIHGIIVQHDLITDSFCREYGNSNTESAPLIYILNTSSFKLMEKMTSTEKIAIIQAITESACRRIFELYKNGFSVGASLKPLEVLQVVSKSVENELLTTGDATSEKRLSIIWTYLIHHAYSFNVGYYALHEMTIIGDKRAYISEKEMVYADWIGEMITTTALSNLKSMFRVLKGLNVSIYELNSVVVAIENNSPVREAMVDAVGEDFLSDFGEAVNELGGPHFISLSNKSKELIEKHFDFNTIEPKKALAYLHLSHGAGSSKTEFEFHVVQHMFTKVRKEISKRVGLKHFTELLKEESKRQEEGLLTICPPKVLI